MQFDPVEHYLQGDIESLLITLYYVQDDADRQRCGNTDAFRHNGICSLQETHAHKLGVYDEAMCRSLREDLYRAWPKYSGVTYYPIPISDEWRELYDDYVWERESEDYDVNPDAEWAYDYCDDCWADEYGDLRYELLVWMIETLERAVRELDEVNLL